MKIIKISLVLSAMAILGGCVAVPVEPGYAAAPPGYYAPPAVYYAPPAIIAPSIGFGFYGSSRSHHGARSHSGGRSGTRGHR